MQIFDLFTVEALGTYATPEFWVAASAKGIRVGVIIVAAIVAAKLASKAVRVIGSRLEKGGAAKGELAAIEMTKRVATFSGMIRLSLHTAIWVIGGIMALKELGFDVMPLVAGAGVVGLAIGFGAQNLVRDVITGLFMLFEDQASVGDVVEINGKGGLVEQVNLRTIVLRDFEGIVHIIPNGTINLLSNRTQSFSFYVFDMGVAYKEDTDRVTELMLKVSDEIQADESFGPQMLEPLQVFGVDKFGDSAVVIKARVKTKPLSQWSVGREFNRRFKKAFDAAGIEIPFPHRTLYYGEGQRPDTGGPDEASLRKVVREELQSLLTAKEAVAES